MRDKETHSPLRPDPQTLELLCRVEISEWLDWMRRELASGGLDLPSAETSVLFAARSVHLAERVHLVCRHLPSRLRTLLIEASLLHMCWTRQRKLGQGLQINAQGSRGLKVHEGVKFVGRWNGENLMQVSDGKQYVVKFPRSDADTALGTEIICIELARLMGLSVPTTCVVLVTRELAREAGIVVGGWPRYVSKGGILSGLGLLVAPGQDEPPKASLSQNNLRFLAGELVFNILVLNLMHESPKFRMVRGHTELVFLYSSYCMMDANWSRFVKASYKDWIPLPLSAVQNITSSDQLESWVGRAQGVDVNRLWELAFSLPVDWYGEHRIVLSSVLRKLDARTESLLESIRYFVQQGYFPNIAGQEDYATALGIRDIA